MDTIDSVAVGDVVPPLATLDLLDACLPVYDVALTEHVVVEAAPEVVFNAAKGFDFLTTDAKVVTVLMTVRMVPGRLRGRPATAPSTLRLATDAGSLPGWVNLGELPGRELVFGAVGTFWKPDIEWRDVPAEEFAAFADPGWGKIACHLLVRPDGPGRSILSYECRTATTDLVSRARMARYWWLIRPFAAYILRAVLRTIRGNVTERYGREVVVDDLTLTSSPDE
jgi:hypothetical protein